MKAKNYLLTFGLVFASVITTYFATNSTAQQQTTAKSDYEYQVGTILFMQKSAEYRALCLQAFNWARLTIEADAQRMKKLPKAERRKPRAVVVDIDETVLDNSPAQALSVKTNQPFGAKEWFNAAKAKPIPGAVEFANYAKSKGVRIFYVSNRDEPYKQATIDNLIAAGFPDISAENVLLRQLDGNQRPISSKEGRRQMVAEKYRIVTLIGDNLNDLSNVFERKSVADRFAETDKVKDLWGTRFIVIPNAMYGEWENAIYEYQRLTEAQKSEKRANALELP